MYYIYIRFYINTILFYISLYSNYWRRKHYIWKFDKYFEKNLANFFVSKINLHVSSRILLVFILTCAKCKVHNTQDFEGLLWILFSGTHHENTIFSFLVSTPFPTFAAWQSRSLTFAISLPAFEIFEDFVFFPSIFYMWKYNCIKKYISMTGEELKLIITNLVVIFMSI